MLIINGSPVVDDDNFAILKTAQIKTDTTAPTDLIITTGAEKTLTLATPVYDDIIITANNLRGGNTTPSFVTFQDSVFALSFRDAETDIVYGAFELPHNYKEGTDLEIHLHWSPSSNNTGNCVFTFKYTVAGMGSATFGAEQTKTLTQAGSGVVNRHQYMTGNTLIAGAGVTIGTIYAFSLTRTQGDAFTGDAFVHSIGVHYEIDTMGSRQRGVK